MANPPYTPIACGLYDRIERLIIEKVPVNIRYRTFGDVQGDGIREVSERITDIYTRDKQEFVLLGSGTEIRLDRLISAADIRFGDDAHHPSC